MSANAKKGQALSKTKIRNKQGQVSFQAGRVKHLVQEKIKSSYENYLADILGVGPNEGTESSGFSPKNLFSMIKKSRQDNRGISSLKDSENLHCGNVTKANLLNLQFQSVFSCLSPLRLGQLCVQNSRKCS